MHVNAATMSAFDRIAARAADVQSAFTPGALPQFDDTASPQPAYPALDPLTVAPPDDAYFVTRDARGRTAYAKDGAFTIRDGALCGADGQPLFGYCENGGALCELRIDTVDAALGRAANVRIGAEGRLLYDRAAIDPRTGARTLETVSAGTLALARFPAGTRAQRVDATHLILPDGVVPHYGRPGDGTFAHLSPMQRAGSNVNLDASLARLADAYLAFDALQAASKAAGKAGKTAMDLVK